LEVQAMTPSNVIEVAKRKVIGCRLPADCLRCTDQLVKRFVGLVGARLVAIQD
jgi:hypothetical protein